jgi:hypothetical protein
MIACLLHNCHNFSHALAAKYEREYEVVRAACHRALLAFIGARRPPPPTQRPDRGGLCRRTWLGRPHRTDQIFIAGVGSHDRTIHTVPVLMRAACLCKHRRKIFRAERVAK